MTRAEQDADLDAVIAALEATLAYRALFAETDILASLALPEFQAAPYLSSGAEARSASYRQEVQRAEVRARVAHITPEEFLRSLEMKVSIAPATLADLPRVAELLGRTNQLNATGRRTDLAVIRRRFEDLASRVIVKCCESCRTSASSRASRRRGVCPWGTRRLRTRCLTGSR